MRRAFSILSRSLGIAALMGTMVFSVSAPLSSADAPVVAGPVVSSPAAAPVTKIAGSPAVYHPKRLSAAVTTGTCATTNYSFQVANKTTASQQVTYNGAAFGPALGQNQALDICVSVAGKYAFGLQSNTAARLVASIH